MMSAAVLPGHRQPHNQAAMRLAFAPGAWTVRARQPIKKLTPADRQARAEASAAERARKEAERQAEREAGIYLPRPLERDFLESGMAPATVVLRVYGDAEGDGERAFRHQREADLAAFVAWRRAHRLAAAEPAVFIEEHA